MAARVATVMVRAGGVGRQHHMMAIGMAVRLATGMARAEMVLGRVEEVVGVVVVTGRGGTIAGRVQVAAGVVVTGRVEAVLGNAGVAAGWPLIVWAIGESKSHLWCREEASCPTRAAS